MGGGHRRRPLSYTHSGMVATAYSSDWRSCGWEWGLALGPLPFYIPLCAGRRPSGTVAWPLVPQHRRQKSDSKVDLLLGGLVLAFAGRETKTSEEKIWTFCFCSHRLRATACCVERGHLQYPTMHFFFERFPENARTLPIHNPIDRNYTRATFKV